jgi:hypothetical protein
MKKLKLVIFLLGLTCISIGIKAKKLVMAVIASELTIKWDC